MLVPVITKRVADPVFIVTLPLVPVAPLAVAKLKVPVPTVPVNFKPKLVKSATPLVKSPAWFSTLFVPEPNPLMVPVNVLVTVTLLVLAAKVVTVLPYASCAVKVFVPVKAVPLVCGLAKLATNLSNVAADTATLRRLAPEVVTAPCVATNSAVSALYNFTKAVPTPLLKVTTVAVPKLISARSLSRAVAAVLGLVELLAPDNTIDLSPVYPVAVFPLASLAVTVIV
ncbi:hypothetical protein AQBE111736_13730 [Aquirufa beregesia]